MIKNNHLISAKKNKNDEFYTLREDIDSYLNSYPDGTFKDKVVYCPCDSRESQFPKYFIDNHERLGIKKLIRSALKDITEVYDWTSGHQVVSVLEHKNIDITDNEVFPDMLDMCDIVVTNPPFSLFVGFVDLLVKMKKQFILVGQQNTISCKSVFEHLMSEYLTVDYSGWPSLYAFFRVPDHYEDIAVSGQHVENCIRVSGVVWYTTLRGLHERPFLELKSSTKDTHYDKFKNFRDISGLDEDCICVNKVKEIPNDWDGYMGVPISFFGKYNPEQFDIIQLDHWGVLGNQDNVIEVNGKPKTTYRRIYIKRKI